MNKSYILTPLILLLTACGNTKFERICDDGVGKRACKDDEVAMIDGIHAIIRAIKNFKDDHLEASFDKLGHTQAMQDAQIYLVGEVHTDVVGKIENLGALNSLLRSGDVLLLEGGDRSRGTIQNCVSNLIFDIYATWAFEKEGRSYIPEKRLEFTQSLRKIYERTKKSYDHGALNLRDVPCAFWDDETAISKEVDPQTLTARNESMVRAIEDNLKKYLKVAVIAGAAHLPLGDILRGMKENLKKPDFPKQVTEFYRIVRQEQRKPKSARTYEVDGLGTTEVIQDYLISSKRLHIQMIHRHFRNAHYQI